MKNKIIKILSGIVFIAAILFNLSMHVGKVDVFQDNAKASDGNYTCYFTYKTGGSWSFILCDNCTRLDNAKRLRDRDKCMPQQE